MPSFRLLVDICMRMLFKSRCILWFCFKEQARKDAEESEPHSYMNLSHLSKSPPSKIPALSSRQPTAQAKITPAQATSSESQPSPTAPVPTPRNAAIDDIPFVEDSSSSEDEDASNIASAFSFGQSSKPAPPAEKVEIRLQAAYVVDFV